jgi:uncharacterized membrane protein (UPF0127 family)
MRCRFNYLITLLLLGAWSTACTAAGDAPLPLAIGKQVFRVELAATLRERERGLMGRTRLAADGGMLFKFETAAAHCFWMRDTPLPLSIAFIDSRGRIVNLADMQAQTDTLHCAAAEVTYALEVALGQFARHGIAVGAQVMGLP